MNNNNMTISFKIAMIMATIQNCYYYLFVVVVVVVVVIVRIIITNVSIVINSEVEPITHYELYRVSLSTTMTLSFNTGYVTKN